MIDKDNKKSDHIQVPVWVIGLLVVVIGAIITGYSSITSNVSTLKSQVARDSGDIKILYQSKIPRSEFNLIIKELDEIKASQIRMEIDLHNHLENK